MNQIKEKHLPKSTICKLILYIVLYPLFDSSLRTSSKLSMPLY